MLRFITSRLLQSLLALYLIVTATFFMLRFVPGGPFTAEKAVPPEILRNLEAHYGLNQPLPRQYLDYLGSLLHGDFGPSFKYSNRTVNEILADKLPVSLELGLWSLGVALLLGLSLGIIAALRRNTWADYLASAVGTCVWVPTTAAARPSRYQPSACFSEVASAWISTNTASARASSPRRLWS